MKKRLWMIMACVLLLVLPMAGCSDDGEVQYLDETFLRELYGDEWVTEETQETSESIPESTAEETAESTEESTEESIEESTEESTEESSEESTEETAALEEDEATFQALIGVWWSEPISVEDMVTEAMKSAGEYEPYLNLDPERLSVRAKFTLYEAGNAVMELDEKSYNELMDYITKEVTGAVLRYYEAYLAGMGMHVKVESYLKFLGISPEKYVAEIIRESTGGLTVADFRRERFCKVKEGKLYVSMSPAGLDVNEDYLEISLDEEGLQFLRYYEAGESVSTPLGLDVNLPMGFQKQE